MSETAESERAAIIAHVRKHANAKLQGTNDLVGAISRDLFRALAAELEAGMHHEKEKPRGKRKR